MRFITINYINILKKRIFWICCRNTRIVVSKCKVTIVMRGKREPDGMKFSADLQVFGMCLGMV